MSQPRGGPGGSSTIAGPEPLVIPVSFAQERLWFLDRLNSGHPTYNIPLAIYLEGAVEVRTVSRALDDLAMRHEVLRTTFRVVDGEPVQVISPVPAVSVATADVSHLPERHRRDAAFACAVDDARVPFDLERGPLLRATLVRLSDREHTLLLTIHHIIADLWSSAVLMRDFVAFFAAHQTGKRADLPILPIQYADFAEWQRERLIGDVLDQLVQYWTTHLADVPREVTFPSDHPRPPVQSFRGETLYFEVPATVPASLGKLCREEGATLFMAVLAAFQLVLGRYAGSTDVVVGTPVANRTRSEIEDLIGFFSNTLVLRTQLDGDPTFRELVRRVKAVTLAAYDHQELPFERLVAEIGVERNLSVPSLFQVLFGLQTTQQGVQAGGTLSGGLGPLEWDEISTGTAKFDATVLVKVTDRGLEGGFEYCTDLYDRETIARIVDHYCTCLRCVADDPDLTLSQVTQRVLAAPTHVVQELATAVQPNGVAGTVDDVCETPVGQFAAQAARIPDRDAVVTGDGRLSYGELDSLSNRLAGFLRDHGVRQGTAVGVCLHPGLALPPVVLGVLKAGAVYVPLDPRYPRARLAFMCRDAALALVVADPASTDLVPAGMPVVTVDPDLSLVDGMPDRGLDLPGGSDIAYVVYTSGSTGQPKGVAVPHRVVANLAAWDHQRSRPAPRTLQLAPLSFDVSVQELCSTWCAGGTLIVCDESVRSDPHLLLAFATAHAVDRMFLPPALLQLLSDAAVPTEWPPSLREIVTAGEQLRVTPSMRQALCHLDGVVLRNQYGPSETHVVTEHTAAWNEVGSLPPIGRPITRARVYVLDDDQVPVPVGARGELCIGGPVLAHGYLGRPELTAERFVPDPLSDVPGARLYRTGDLARFRADGSLQFLGRADDQLKIRGYRVEPAEVEAALEQLDGVHAAAVVGQADLDGGPIRLVAYVQCTRRGSASAPQRGADLRPLLRERLPQWMVPERILLVDELPTTPSGKVDRRALVRRELASEEGAGGSNRPPTPLERVVSEVWAEVLGVDEVGVDESFFDLGGHSIALARVVARIHERFDVALPFRALFDAPTVEELSRELVAQRALALDRDDFECLLRDVEEAAQAVGLDR